MVGAKTFTVYLFVYKLANYSSAKNLFRQTFVLSCVLAKAQKLQTIHAFSFLATVKQSSRLVLKRGRKPARKTELAKCLEKFYLSGRQKYRGITKPLLSEALELAEKNVQYHNRSRVLASNKALDASIKTPRKDGEIACVVNKETLTREIVEELA